MNWEIETFLEIKDAQLSINGVRALDLAAAFDTPLFVYSESRIKHNIGRLYRAESVIDCRLKVCYAAKANSNLAVLRCVRDAGADIEVNSGGELFKALKIGFRPGQIIFNGTSKTELELAEAVAAGIYAIQADSLFELELTERIARSLGKRANVSLRLVPEIESDTLHGLQTALLTSKFGMMPDEALEAFRRWKPDNEFLNLCGIHLHLGSQNPASVPYAEALETLFENLRQIHDRTGHLLSHLNLGGGFPVNYLRDPMHYQEFPAAKRELFSASLEPDEVLKSAWKVVKAAARRSNASRLLENIELLIEPGRSIIADAGICLTTVRNKKQRPIRYFEGETSQIRDAKSEIDSWLLTDAGFNILLSMETYKWYYHLISATRAGEKHDTRYKLAGPLCDGGDVYFDIERLGRLPDHRRLPEDVDVGEVLALLNCGAYSIAQMFQYNGQRLPAVVLIRENGDVELARRRDSYEDLLINEVF